MTKAATFQSKTVEVMDRQARELRLIRLLLEKILKALDSSEE